MKTIVLADDEQCSLITLAEGLQEYCEDWIILTAANGKQASEILAAGPVDLVVTDLKMPIMNGYELLEYVKENRAGMPVIVMTGDDSFNVQSRLLRLGVAQCLLKPFHLSDMSQAIASQLVEK
jgi:YesN/AraC family two-component response regulator